MMNTTARITATGLATLVMALGLGAGAAAGVAAAGVAAAGVAGARHGMPAGSPLAVPCDLTNPEPDGPDPTNGPTDVVLPTPYPHPDLSGLEAPTLPTEPEIVIDSDLVWPEEDCAGPHGGGGGVGEPTGEPGDEPTGQGEPGSGDPDGTGGTEGPAGTDGSGGGGSAPQAPTAGDEPLAYTGVGAGMLTAAFLTIIGAGVFALLLARTLHQRTRRP